MDWQEAVEVCSLYYVEFCDVYSVCVSERARPRVVCGSGEWWRGEGRPVQPRSVDDTAIRGLWHHTTSLQLQQHYYRAILFVFIFTFYKNFLIFKFSCWFLHFWRSILLQFSLLTILMIYIYIYIHHINQVFSFEYFGTFKYTVHNFTEVSCV